MKHVITWRKRIHSICMNYNKSWQMKGFYIISTISILYHYRNGSQCNIQSICIGRSRCGVLFLRKINYHGECVEIWNFIVNASYGGRVTRGETEDFMMNRVLFHLKMSCLSIINDHSEHRIHRLDGCSHCGRLQIHGESWSCELWHTVR